MPSHPPQARWLIPALILLGTSACTMQAESFCLDFRWNPNPDNLVRYDFSILDIQSEPDLGPGHAAGKKFFSYLSVGEIAGDAPYLREVKARGVRMLSYNHEWDSHYPDLSDPRWADYVVHQLAPKIAGKGFDGFFLDTVDAVETMMQLQPSRANRHHGGMANLIRGLKNKYPDKEIILNRGFAVFDAVQDSVKGMLVEELFQRDDYTERSANGIAQLLARIAPVTAAGKPVYIVDYVPPWNLTLAKDTANRIAALGFHPAVIPQEIDGTVLAPTPGKTTVPAPALPGTEITAPKLLVRRSVSTRAVVVRVPAKPGKIYVVQARDSVKSPWQDWRRLDPVPEPKIVELYDFDNLDNHSGRTRFYQLTVR